MAEALGLPDHGRIKEEVTCAVCLELFDHPLLLPCSHTFCKACLETMLATPLHDSFTRPSLRCPQCQEEVLLPQGVGQLRKNNLAANIVASLTKSQADRPSDADDSTRKDANRSQRPSAQGQLKKLQNCLEEQQCAIADQQEKVQKDLDHIARQAEERKRQVTDYFRKMTAQLQAREQQLHQEVDAAQVKATTGLQGHLSNLESRMADVISTTDKVSDLIKKDVPSAESSLHDEVDGVTKQTKEVCISLPEVAVEETEALDHLHLYGPSINNLCKLITLQAATNPQSTCESAQEREVKKKLGMPFNHDRASPQLQHSHFTPPSSMGSVTTYAHGQMTGLSAPYAPGFQTRQQVVAMPMGQPGTSGQQGVVPAGLHAPVTIRPPQHPAPHMPMAQPGSQVIHQGIPVGGPWPTHGYPISAPSPLGMASPHMPLAQPGGQFIHQGTPVGGPWPTHGYPISAPSPPSMASPHMPLAQAGAWIPPPATSTGVLQPYYYPNSSVVSAHYLSTAQVGRQVATQGLSAGGQQPIAGQSPSVGAAVSSTMAQSAGQFPQSASTGGQQPITGQSPSVEDAVSSTMARSAGLIPPQSASTGGQQSITGQSPSVEDAVSSTMTQSAGLIPPQSASTGGQQSITEQSPSVEDAVSSTMTQSAGPVPPQSASTGGQQPQSQASSYKFTTPMRNPSPVQVTQEPQPQSAMGSRPKVCESAEEVEQQEPLTATILAAAPPQEQKEMLGKRLFPLIRDMHGDLAGKITGMLLEIDNMELLQMLESHDSLKAKVEEAFAVLQAHSQKESAKQDAAVKTPEGSAEGERREDSRKKKAKKKKGKKLI